MSADSVETRAKLNEEFRPQYLAYLAGIDGNMHDMLVDPANRTMRAVRDSSEKARYAYKRVFDPFETLAFPLTFFFRGNPVWAWRLRDITEYPEGTRISLTGIRLDVIAAGIFIIGWFWILAQIFQRKW
ncbi:hypothetical protein HGP17_03750 [Rhizobium sp. P38BS-XIX]|uniref:hypothetical protein n=1 Tax=Rhizobium sp. P38BS-XIX TaxID=2726740 RepID=UPI0014574247|nr:hypothetical protein [Rhizobium sp. P38BS-XIX]NLR95939.1 hypothetical protein [Rhizobium sp. P38BS-XIX]